MADLNPEIIMQEHDPTYYRAANDQSNLSQAQTTGVGLENKIRQQQIDQGTYDANFRKTLDTILAQSVSQAQTPQPSSTLPTAPAPPQTDAMGNPVGQLGPQTASPAAPLPEDGGQSRPSLAAPPGPNPTGAGTGVEPPTGLPGETAPAGTPSPTSPVDNTPPFTPPTKPAFASPGSPGYMLNMQNVQQKLADAGFGSKALAMNPALMEAATKGIDLQTKQYELLAKQHDQVASIVGNVLLNQVDPNEQDPVKLQAQKDSWIGAYNVANQNLLKAGLESPQDYQTHAQMAAKGWSPELQQQAEGVVSAASNSVALHGMIANKLKESREALTSGATLRKTNLEIDEKQKDADAALLGGAKDAADYATKYDSLPAERAKLFPAPAEWDAKSSPDVIRHVGMTSEQQVSEANRQASLAALGTNRDVVNAQRQEIIDLREAQKGKESASDKAAQRQAGAQLMSLQQKERNQYQAISGLSSQIALANAGKPFFEVDDKGKQIGRVALNPQSDEGVAALTSMKQAAKSAYDRAADITDDKYDILEQHGGTPTVSRDDAKGKLDAGRSSIDQWGKAAPTPPKNNPVNPSTTPPAKPATATASKPPSKVLDRATATSYLQKAGGDKAKARQLATADGYTIPQQ